MVTKLVLDSIRQADSGSVTCTLETASGLVSGTIEKTFFEEFFAGQQQALTPSRTQRVLTENQAWLEAEAERQLASGANQVVIR